MKFYETGQLVLFDLDQDLSEQNDLSQQMAQRVKELDGLLVKYLKDVDAQMAESNPQYDPSREPGVQKDRGGRAKGRMKPKPIRGLMVARKRTYRAGDENWSGRDALRATAHPGDRSVVTIMLVVTLRRQTPFSVLGRYGIGIAQLVELHALVARALCIEQK